VSEGLARHPSPWLFSTTIGSSSDLATIADSSDVIIPRLAFPLPPQALQCSRRRDRQPGRSNCAKTIPIVKGDGYSSRQCGIDPGPGRNGCRGDLWGGGGTEPVRQPLDLCHVPDLHYSPGCKHFDVPTLSADAARDTFYSIYDSDDRSNLVDGILEQLDFHPLSITLLATVAHQNKWGTDRLAREWEKRRTSVLQTRHKKSLATTIEISLASPMFQEFGPDARALLEVVAFFPQGVDENNAIGCFPPSPTGIDILDGFCVLSLTHRSNGFITMLAPLRDYLSPKDPKLSALLCAVKERYFIRMSVDLNPNQPEFGEARWIRSEDVNVEHLLDVFTTIDGDSDDVWDACADFMSHLRWHKNRPTVLRAKIEGLPDDHCCKPKCLYELSRLFGSIGNLRGLQTAPYSHFEAREGAGG
jgi:hypothetical protein